MTDHSIFLLVFYLIVLLLIAKPLGEYIATVIEGKLILASQFSRSIEFSFYRLCGVRPQEEMKWRSYLFSLLLFNLFGFLAVYLLQRTQSWLPLNPQNFPNVSADSALNTAVSFVSNTNWQSYAGESTMSYLTQTLGLGVQNFLSAATGISVAIALIRGFARRTAQHIGNPWVDLTRISLYILLPLSLAYSSFLVSQGVLQNFDSYQTVTSLEGQEQVLPMGPVASQEAIKLLGTNGGGFFNANSAHPFENPTPLSNFTQMLAIFLIPAALCFTFGRMVGDYRQGLALLSAMVLVFIIVALAAMYFEQQGNPLLAQLGIDSSAGNLEGKEVRFGASDSGLFATITTLTSCGATNASHDSFLPMGGFVLLWNMMLGEVIFGGAGSGLYGILIFSILTVFVSGLMIGRTPEYLGKKIEAFEMKMISFVILIPPILALLGTALALVLPEGVSRIGNPGAHGFSEVLYAFVSTANNNGSAFSGLSADTPFYNFLTAMVMLLGRFALMVPVLAMAGSLAEKKRVPTSAGTLPTHGLLFVMLLIGIIILVGALSYLPALALGPVVEHLALFSR
ncbi:K(+) transporting P-type ATPase subunit KdpA [Gammaproteobacteria bacterium]